MSALACDDNADKPTASVSPGIADLQEQNEVRRIQECIATLTQRHGTSMAYLQRRPPSLDQYGDIEAEVPTPPSSEQTAELEEMPRGAWTQTLEPVMMPSAPQEMRPLPSYATLAGAVAAICVAGGVALAVTNSLWAPANAGVSSGTDAGQSHSFSNTLLTDLTQIRPAEARVRTAEPSPTPALAAFAAFHQNTDTAPARSPDVLLPTEAAIAAPAAAAVPEPPATPAFSPDEVSAMLQRARDLIDAGDIASARLMLQPVAESGSADASLALARTFDPAMFAKLRVVGVRPDPAKARTWYAKAAEQGSPEARQRVQQQALR